MLAGIDGGVVWGAMLINVVARGLDVITFLIDDNDGCDMLIVFVSLTVNEIGLVEGGTAAGRTIRSFPPDEIDSSRVCVDLIFRNVSEDMGGRPALLNVCFIYLAKLFS